MDCNSPSGSAPAPPSSQSRSTTPTIRRESRTRGRVGNDAMAGHSQNVGRRVVGITHGTRPIGIGDRRPSIGARPYTGKRWRGVRTRSLAGPKEAISLMSTRRANLRNRPRDFMPKIGGLLRGFRRRTLPTPARRPGRMRHRFSARAWGRLRIRTAGGIHGPIRPSSIRRILIGGADRRGIAPGSGFAPLLRVNHQRNRGRRRDGHGQHMNQALGESRQHRGGL